MSQYRTGIITSNAAAVSLELGFIPDHFVVTNYTKSAVGTGVGKSEWFRATQPNGYAFITTLTAGAGVTTQITTNGFTVLNSGAQFANTNYTITGVSKTSPAVVTMASTTGLANGNTITISNVVGMTQLNTNRYIIGGLTGTTFTLYDLYGNPVNASAFGTYTSGGIANVISTPAIAPVINATTGQVITPGQAPGLVVDTGFYGITFGTGVVGANNDILIWEAWYSTPTGW